MKNVTITLPQHVASWARVKAAKEGTSVSRMLGSMLESEMKRDDEYELARQRAFSVKPRNLNDGKPYPKREELYDRPGLR